jgi:hypothetical protein
MSDDRFADDRDVWVSPGRRRSTNTAAYHIVPDCDLGPDNPMRWDFATAQSYDLNPCERCVLDEPKNHNGGGSNDHLESIRAYLESQGEDVASEPNAKGQQVDPITGAFVSND